MSAKSTTTASGVPARLRHLFWNTAESQLDVRRADPYIARRLLREMDLQGLAWGARSLSRQDWERVAEARGLDPKTRALALSLAEAASRGSKVSALPERLAEPAPPQPNRVIGESDISKVCYPNPLLFAIFML